MPCMGPSYDFAEEQGEKAYKEIMELLETKYNIKNWPPVADIAEGSTDANFMRNHWAKTSREWDERAGDLQKAIIELIWHQHSMDF